VSESKIVGWDGHVARIGERRSAYMFLVEKLRERDHLEDPDVDGTIILKSIIKKWNGRPRSGMGGLELD